MMDKIKPIYASAWSATITVLFVTVVTVSADLSPSFKTWLANFTGHHWVTKSWASIIIFVVLLLLLKILTKQVGERQLQIALTVLQVVTVVCSFVLLGFYCYEFLH